MKNLHVHYELIIIQEHYYIALSFTQAFASAFFICNIPASVTRLLCVYCLIRFIAYRMRIRMSKAGPCRIRAAYITIQSQSLLFCSCAGQFCTHPESWTSLLHGFVVVLVRSSVSEWGFYRPGPLAPGKAGLLFLLGLITTLPSAVN